MKLLSKLISIMVICFLIMGLSSCVTDYKEISDYRYYEIPFDKVINKLEDDFHTYKIESYNEFNKYFVYETDSELNPIVSDVLNKKDKYFNDFVLIYFTYSHDKYLKWIDIEYVKIENNKLIIKLFYGDSIIDEHRAQERFLIEIPKEDISNIYEVEVIKDYRSVYEWGRK
jgi:hypothetical protein